MNTIFELWILVPALGFYMLSRFAGFWLADSLGEYYDRYMQSLEFCLKILATLFVVWGLYLIVSAKSLGSPIEFIAIAGYGMMQFGFAFILYVFPKIGWSSFIEVIFRSFD